MKTRRIVFSLIATLCFTLAQDSFNSISDYTFDLSGTRTNQTTYYKMNTDVLTFGLDTKLQSKFTMSLYLAVNKSQAGNEKYTCSKFELKFPDGKTVSIPKLENWEYEYTMGLDDKNQVFGIDHSNFENLADSEGKPVLAEKNYLIYNSFIDFHGLNNVFADPMTGQGIEQLTKIGQKMIHAAANTKAPTNLGDSFKEGSYFQNGEITLELLGISSVNSKLCGIVKYDSGESKFEMLVSPAPNIDVATTGRSHYFGEIYKNLETNWIEKANMTEIVITETSLPMPPNKINSVIERHINLTQLTETEFQK